MYAANYVEEMPTKKQIFRYRISNISRSVIPILDLISGCLNFIPISEWSDIGLSPISECPDRGLSAQLWPGNNSHSAHFLMYRLPVQTLPGCAVVFLLNVMQYFFISTTR